MMTEPNNNNNNNNNNNSERKLPVQLPGQSHIMLQQAGQRQSIRSQHLAMRLVGFTQARHQIGNLSKYEDLGEMLLCQAGTWKLLTHEPFASPEAEFEVTTQALQEYHEMVKKSKKDLKERVQKDQERKGEPNEVANEPTISDTPPAQAPPGQAPPPCDTGNAVVAMCEAQETRGQKFAAIGVIHRGDGSVLVCAFGALKTEAECNGWIKNTLRHKYPVFDMYCVDMYEWVHPHMVRSRVPQKEIPFTYPDDQVQGWMKHHVDQETEVATFEEQMKAQGRSEEDYVVQLGPQEVKAP